MLDNIKIVFAAIGAFLGSLLGGMDGLLYALLVFVVIDYISGVIIAIINNKLSSEVGFKGIAKKVLIFGLVIIGNLLDTKVIGAGATFRTAVIMFYIANEGISILENASSLGLPFPKKLKEILIQLKDDSDKSVELIESDEVK